jgi:peptidoglycan/xylan/chitin deacetylase (PgdA/CDA1 family)
VSRRLGWASVVSCAAVVAAGGVAAPTAQSATTSPVVVSLTFDDALANQSVVPAMLDAHGMKGTFFVPSDDVGTSGHLSWGQLSTVAADGQEIAGHTLDHVDLTSVSTSEAQYQACEDRARLLNHGFAATSFAYPYGAENPTVQSIVRGCGYNSARRAWGLVGPDCTSCTAWAETIPPTNAYAILTADNPKSTTTLDTIESYVTGAETHGGGWVILVFHNICDGCETFSTSQSTLQGFLDWLQPRAANGTVVQTINQVIGGSVQPSPGTADSVLPTSSISCNGAACAGPYSGSVQVGLTGSDTGGSGFEAIRYTTDGTSPTLASPVYTAPFTVSGTTTVKYQAWDNAGNAQPVQTQVIQIQTQTDNTAPTVAITSPANNASVSGTVQVQATASDSGSGVARVTFSLDGAPMSTSTSLPYKWVWNTRKSAKGSHTVTAVAVDRAGNTSAPATITVTVTGK